jgi:hypothetical protein
MVVLPNGGNWRAAGKKYEAEKDDLEHGRRRLIIDSDGATVQDLVDNFIHSKVQRMESRELGAGTVSEYREFCNLAAQHLGKMRIVENLRPEDFRDMRAAVAKKWGPHRLGKLKRRALPADVRGQNKCAYEEHPKRKEQRDPGEVRNY